MAVFKARVDTINAHAGLAGKHPGHMSDTFARMAKEQGLSKEDLRDMDSEDKKKFTKEVQEIACKEYLAVFFIK